VGLFDKLFGRKKESQNAEPEKATQYVAGDAVSSTKAGKAKSDGKDQATAAVAASMSNKSSTQAAGTVEPSPSDSAEQQPSNAADQETTSQPEAEAVSQAGAPDESAEASHNSHPSPGIAATVVCSGCGRDLPVPLPGHPTTIVCPFCTAQTDYTP